MSAFPARGKDGFDLCVAVHLPGEHGEVALSNP